MVLAEKAASSPAFRCHVQLVAHARAHRADQRFVVEDELHSRPLSGKDGEVYPIAPLLYDQDGRFSAFPDEIRLHGVLFLCRPNNGLRRCKSVGSPSEQGKGLLAVQGRHLERLVVFAEFGGKYVVLRLYSRIKRVEAFLNLLDLLL